VIDEDALARRAHQIRRHIVDMAAGPAGAHVGGSLSAADIMTVLYFAVLRVRPEQPAWPERDYFVLSKGHAAAVLYAVLAERGFLPVAELSGYARAGSRLAGHPSRAVPGVEFSTGSLGHGLSLGVGTALAAHRDGRSNRVFVLLGDGELQEGSVWEAVSAASFLGLGNLIAIIDRNQLQISGSTRQRSGLDALAARWSSFGWTVREADGHDHGGLARVLRAAAFPEGARPDGPTVLIARTVKGRGLTFLENRKSSHYGTFSPAMRQRALTELATLSMPSGQEEPA
jgi:transketolase